LNDLFDIYFQVLKSEQASRRRKIRPVGLDEPPDAAMGGGLDYLQRDTEDFTY